jgi:anti-sigma-K factor RskA
VTREEARELIAAYALHALSPEDAREVESHVRASEELRRELAAYQDVTAALAAGVPQVDPPAHLRARIMRAIAAEGEGTPATAPTIGATRPQGEWARTAPRSRAWALGLAAAAALAIVFAGTTFSLNQRLSALNHRLAEQERVLAILANPGSKVASLAGAVQASVRFVYHSETKQGALVVSDLADPGQGMVYQLWLIAGGNPESVTVFRPAAGRPIILPVGADFTRYQVVAITVERGPAGNPTPTSTPILAASL